MWQRKPLSSKIATDGSTHRLLLSFEDSGNCVSSTHASPSVKEIYYYMLGNLKYIDRG